MYLFPVFLPLKGVYLSETPTLGYFGTCWLLAFPFLPGTHRDWREGILTDYVYEGKVICTSFRGLLLLLSNSLILFNHVDTMRGWLAEGLK